MTKALKETVQIPATAFDAGHSSIRAVEAHPMNHCSSIRNLRGVEIWEASDCCCTPTVGFGAPVDFSRTV